jgi:hypothetical protein
MKGTIKSIFIFLAIIYFVGLIINLWYPLNIEGHRARGGAINSFHVNEGPYRIGGDSRFSSRGVGLSTNVYDANPPYSPQQNSYCYNNPNSTPCKGR